MPQKELIMVLVHYMAAGKPFKTEVESTTTVGQIKSAALTAFGLTEDAQKVYKLYYNKTELANLNQTIGEVAGHQKTLNLKLEEELVQGV